MKNIVHRILSIAAACALLSSAALAESISFNGTVAAGSTSEVYAPIGGTIERIEVQTGEKVSAGDVLATLKPERIYASESGIITGIFGQAGDSAEAIAGKYGAVMYIEGESKYTIAASTEDAYNRSENKYVRVGEDVTLVCYSDGGHSGTGTITAVEGTNFSVEVQSGEFVVGETVNVFRGSSTSSSDRIGRGTLSRQNPIAVSGSGSIVSVAVENGASVKRGDLLFETLSGSFDGLYMSGTRILAHEDGVVASINMQQGGKLEKGSVAAVLYPAESMRIEGKIEEANLSLVSVGDAVEIELIWNQDEEITYTGVISMISAVANSAEGGDNGEVTYNVYVDFTPDVNTRYGMTAIVTTVDKMLEDAGNEE